MYGDNGDRPRVERWDTLEVLHRSAYDVADGKLSVVIEVQQPVFEDGRKGRVKLGCAIQRGERTLRIPCRDGNTSEVKTVVTMLQTLTEDVLKVCEARFREIDEEHRPPPRTYDNTAGAGRSGGGGPLRYTEPGMGLSRFSGPSNGTSPKRQKRRERRDRDFAEE